MGTKTETPDQLRARADKLAVQAAEAQTKVDAAAAAEREREWQEMLAADQVMVDTFNAAALDRDVDDARQRLEEIIAEQPVTQALADLIHAQYRRNWAHADLSAARSRLGLPEERGRSSSNLVHPLEEYVQAAAERAAQERIDAERTSEAGR